MPIVDASKIKSFAIFLSSLSVSNRSTFTRTLPANPFGQAEIAIFFLPFCVKYILPFLLSCHFCLGLLVRYIIDQTFSSFIADADVFATACVEPYSIPSAAFKDSFITPIFTNFVGGFRFPIDTRSCKATSTLIRSHTGTTQSLTEICIL